MGQTAVQLLEASQVSSRSDTASGMFPQYA